MCVKERREDRTEDVEQLLCQNEEVGVSVQLNRGVQ